MISAGAHRYSWVDIDNIPEECDRETNFGADVARVENDCNEEYTTLFQIYHELLSNNIDSLPIDLAYNLTSFLDWDIV